MKKKHKNTDNYFLHQLKMVYYKKAWLKGELWGKYILLGERAKIDNYLEELEKTLCAVQALERVSYQCIVRVSAVELTNELLERICELEIGYMLNQQQKMNLIIFAN